jgi:hypothetical protein
MRSLALAKGIANAGHKVTYHGRGEVSNADLYIQTGFAGTVGLRGQIDSGKPYIIAEAPFWRNCDIDKISSFGYNGLAGGAFRPPAGSDKRPHPRLEELKDEGHTIVFGQKPTDHSLRGSNHGDWIRRKLEEHPGAYFRPHPLAVPAGSLGPIAHAIHGCHRSITFTSTVGAEALIAGCESDPEHRGSTAYGVTASGTSREEWVHQLSWGQFSHEEYEAEETGRYILSGYDEALSRALVGDVERPRERVDGQVIQREYDRIVLCPTIAERTLWK